MSNDMKKENKELGQLININEDAVEFYETAQEHADNPQMKTTFSNLENLHKGVITNLEQIVRANGGEPDADETIEGGVRQFFGELHAKISNDVDETLVTHLEEAEDRCLHSMQDAMESNDIRPLTKNVLRQELSALQKSHDYMKALKDSMKEAA
jgi:uncharacterized protein (TIGR02284 family)